MIDLGSGVQINQLVFTNQPGGYTIGNGGIGIQTLTLDAGGSIRVENGVSNSQIINARINLTGNGTITDSAAVLTVYGDITGSSAALTLNGTNANNPTIAGSISGLGLQVIKDETGTWILTGSNSYTGGTSINAGTLKIPTAVSLPQYSVMNAVIVNNTGTLALNVGGTTGQAWAVSEISSLLLFGDFNAGSTLEIDTTIGNFEYTPDINIASGLKKSGAHILTLYGTNTYAGATTVSAGTLLFAQTAALPNAAVLTVNSGATVAVRAGGSGWTDTDITTLLGAATFDNGSSFGIDTSNVTSFTYGNVITDDVGTLGLSKLGDNVLFLTNTNTYTGVTTFTGGYLSVDTIGDGGIAGNLGAATNAAANLVFDGGTLQYTGASASTNRNFTINAGKTGTIKVFNSNLTISGAAAATNGALTKTGNGTLTLSGANLHTGATTITEGTLSVGASANLGNANSLVFDGGTLEVTGTSMTNFGAHTPVFNASATVGLNIDNASNTFTVSQQLNQTTGGLTKSGSGTLTLTNANNTYTGTTQVSLGTLSLSAATTNNIASSATINVASGATLDVTGLTSSTLNLASGQTLQGNGTVTGGLIIDTGSHLAPGSSPGTINTGSTTYDVGGTYDWEITNVVGVAGTGWDLQNISGALTISASSGSPFTINISGSDGVNFDNNTAYAWTIAAASGGISGFAANKFTLIDGFSTAHTGTFSITTSGNDLRLTYAPAIANAYWKGDQNSVWNTNNPGPNTNWATAAGGGTDPGALPGAISDVFFTVTSGAANFTTTLGQDFSIKGLTFTGTGTDAATHSVTIGGSNMLTLGVNGVTIDAGSAAHTISSSLTLGSAQSWTNNSASTFTVNGNVTNGANMLTVAGDGNTTISGALGNGAGGLTKNGSGTLILSGVNNYSGVTTISGGTLQVGDNGTTGQLGSGDVTNNGALVFKRTNDLTVSNNISGSGSVDQAGSGTLVLSGTNTFAGALTVSFGTLALSGGSAIADTAAVSLANASGAALRFDASETIGSLSGGGTNGGNVNLQGNTLTTGDAADTTFAGAMSGTGGALIKQGAGTFTLTGMNTYTGATTISNGTLQIGSGGMTGMLGAGAVTDNAALVFNRSNALTVSNNISGGGTVTQSGTGTLTLGGTNSYTGATTVNSGTLVTTDLAGRLTLTGGTLSLGTQNLNVAGIYTQGAASAVNITINDNSNFGRITSPSANAVNGGTINVTVGSNYIANGTPFNVVNGVSGAVNTMPTIKSSSFVIGFTGSASNGDLILTLNRSGGDNAVAAGGTANEQAVWTTLEQIGQQNPTGDMLNVLNLLDNLGSAQELLDALSTMTPDVSSGTVNASRDLTGVFLASVSNRLGAARGGQGLATGDVMNGTGIWVQGLGSNMKQDVRKGIEGYSANAFGTTLGADKLIDRHVRVGLAAGYGFSDVNSKQPGRPSDDINSWSGILYGSFDSLDLCHARKKGRKSRVAVRNQGENFWYVDGMFGFAQHNYDSRREIWLGSIKRVAKAAHYAQQYTTSFEAGHTFVFERTKDLEITPFVSLGYSCLYLNKYKENGADALNLTVRGKGFNQLEQGLGTKLAYPFIVKKTGTFVPSLKAAWLFDYISDRFETEATLAGGGPSFTTNGVKPARNGLLLGAEVAFLSKGNMTLTGNYDLELKDEYISNTYYGTARLDF